MSRKRVCWYEWDSCSYLRFLFIVIEFSRKIRVVIYRLTELFMENRFILVLFLKVILFIIVF